MEAGTRREWATIDRHGWLQPWSTEEQAREYVEQRVRFESAEPGAERVVYRDVSITEWMPAG